MSSTSVHSKQNNNKYCASAQIIPTPEKGLEIPPKKAKPGPTRYAVKSEELILEISSVGSYEIGKDGVVIDSNSGEKLGIVSMGQVSNSKEIRIQRAPSTYGKDKDEKEGKKQNKGMETR